MRGKKRSWWGSALIEALADMIDALTDIFTS
jgi:hypothetical protein